MGNLEQEPSRESASEADRGQEAQEGGLEAALQRIAADLEKANQFDAYRAQIDKEGQHNGMQEDIWDISANLRLQAQRSCDALGLAFPGRDLLGEARVITEAAQQPPIDISPGTEGRVAIGGAAYDVYEEQEAAAKDAVMAQFGASSEY